MEVNAEVHACGQSMASRRTLPHQPLHAAEAQLPVGHCGGGVRHSSAPSSCSQGDELHSPVRLQRPQQHLPRGHLCHLPAGLQQPPAGQPDDGPQQAVLWLHSGFPI